MIELEKTYLAKFIPVKLEKCKHKEIIDIYMPQDHGHSSLRIRKKGDEYELTKKNQIDANDSSKLKEQTVQLTKQEFDFLSQLKGRMVHKIRYYFNYKARVCEIDVFQGALKGLIVIEIEFENEEEKESFEMPDFCLADITQENFIAGGLICGKTYEDVEEYLNRYGYRKIFYEVNKNG